MMLIISSRVKSPVVGGVVEFSAIFLLSVGQNRKVRGSK